MEEFTREAIEQFFHDIVKNDKKEHHVTGVYRLACLDQPAWVLIDHTIGDIIGEPMDVAHVLYLQDGKLAMCWTREMKKTLPLP